MKRSYLIQGVIDINGTIRLPEGKDEWIDILKSIYEFESHRISGPGSYRNDIQNILWYKEEVVEYLKNKNIDSDGLDSLMYWLGKERQLFITNTSSVPKYLTRVGETVRILGFCYEYWPRCNVGIDTIRWLVDDKKIPKYEIRTGDFIDNVKNTMDSALKGTYIHPNLPDAIDRVVKGAAKAINRDDWENVTFSKFQLESTIEILKSRYISDYNIKANVLTAGVGSGKTYAFSIPALISAVESILSGDDGRRTHIFIYPRKALAKDQFNTLNEMIKHIDCNQLEVHLEHSSSPLYSKSVKKGIERVYKPYDENVPPPTIIVTTLETLKRRLYNPWFLKKVSDRLTLVILDEIHLVLGLTGGLSAGLLKRLKCVSKRKLTWIGSSATIAEPGRHTAKIFGLEPVETQVIRPYDEDMRSAGIEHNVFTRPMPMTSGMGTLVNTTSLLIHSRRDSLPRRSEHPSSRSIAFADNLDLLGRWNADLRENERTEWERFRNHPDKEDYNEWKNAREREIPYAYRFYRPLQNRIEARGGKENEYTPLLPRWKGERVCDSCKSGKHISMGKMKKENLNELLRLVYRIQSDKGFGKLKAYRLNNRIISDWPDEIDIGTLDMCPFLRIGACLWFPLADLEVEEIPSSEPKCYDWTRTIRSKIYSSKTSLSDIELDDDLSEEIFTASPKELYDVWKVKKDRKVPLDLVLSSPSLEVGIDLKDITEGILYRAVRNVASYRQKVGRVGREERTDKVSVTQISKLPIDLHYYRQPWNLIDRGHLDPLPIPTRNESIIRWMIYNGVWDKLAAVLDPPEVIPYKGAIIKGHPTEFNKSLEMCMKYIQNNESSLRDHLYNLSKGSFVGPDDDKITGAIKQVKSELNIFLSDIPDTVFKEDIDNIADMIIYVLSKRPVTLNKSDVYSEILDIEKDFLMIRPKIDSSKYDISKQMAKFDTYSRCGWIDYDDIFQVCDQVKGKIEHAIKSKKYNSRKEKRNLERLINLIDYLTGSLRDIPQEEILARSFYKKLIDIKEGWKRYYLSSMMETIDIFEILRVHKSQKRLANLYTDPYESNVIVNIGHEQKIIQADEFMYGMVPGTWTYRFGKVPLKVKSGRATPTGSGLIFERRDFDKDGYVKIKEDVTPPPDLKVDENLTIYAPISLDMFRAQKYLKLHINRPTVGDGDEDDEISIGNRDKPAVKVPKSSPSRWVDISTEHEEPVIINPLNVDDMIFEGKDKIVGKDIASKIKHPLQGDLIEGVKWHQNLKLLDYIYSVTRQYSSGRGIVELIYADEGSRIAFGNKKISEGISISLNPDRVQSVTAHIKEGICNGVSEWAPTGMKAVKSYICERTGVPIWFIEDIIGIVVSHAYPEISSNFPVRLLDILTEIWNSGEFNKIASDYYCAKLNYAHLDEDIDDVSINRDEDISSKVNTIQNIVNELMNQKTNHKKEFIDDLDDWIIKTIVCSFGMASINALQRLSGLDEQDVGYSVDLESLQENEYRIYLYDKTSYGNGSCRLLKRHFHILDIQRHRMNEESVALPSEDFITLLQQELFQCPQYHTDMNALNMMGYGMLGELGYITPESEEVHRVSGNTWAHLGITNRDAWKLPILFHAPHYISEKEGLETDDLVRATNICWCGCPECLINRPAMLGSRTAENLLDKAILDYLVLDSWTARDEYDIIDVDDVLQGFPEGLGKPLRLKVKIQNDSKSKTLRSYALPYTLGLWLFREGGCEKVSIIIQKTDIIGSDVHEGGGKSAHGMSAMGFSRLMGYSLMMTSFLEILNKVPEDRKKVRLVFYDCRDIDLERLSISPRIKEAIRYDKDGMIRIEKLTDILLWLAGKGYKIDICVDYWRSKESAVHELLSKMKSSGVVNINLYTKNQGFYGSMHKKILQTPIAILQGSANLTFSGTRSNGESVNYFPYTTEGYREIEITVKDEIDDAEPWYP